MTRSLRIGSWNVCNGIAMKMDYVKNAITEYDLDILFIQEAELKKIPKKTCTAYKVTQRNFVLL